MFSLTQPHSRDPDGNHIKECGKEEAMTQGVATPPSRAWAFGILKMRGLAAENCSNQKLG